MDDSLNYRESFRRQKVQLAHFFILMKIPLNCDTSFVSTLSQWMMMVKMSLKPDNCKWISNAVVGCRSG